MPQTPLVRGSRPLVLCFPWGKCYPDNLDMCLVRLCLKLENLVRATGGKNSEQICNVLWRQHGAQRQTGPLLLRRHASDQHHPHGTLGRAFNTSGSQLSHWGSGHALCSFGLENDLLFSHCLLEHIKAAPLPTSFGFLLRIESNASHENTVLYIESAPSASEGNV